DGHTGFSISQRLHHFDAVHARHHQIGQHQIWNLILVKRFEHLHRIRERLDDKSFPTEDLHEHFSDLRLVVDYVNAFFHRPGLVWWQSLTFDSHARLDRVSG